MVCRVPDHRIFTHLRPYGKNLGSKPQLFPMDLTEKIRTIPLQPGVYLYKNAEGVTVAGFKRFGDELGVIAF